MATKEELYISISPDTYRANKSNVLMCQANLLATLQKLYNLKVLERQKHDLKIKLHKLFSLVLSEFNSIQEKLPTPKIPKEIQRTKEPEAKPKESFSKRDDIENELKAIQEKLRQLNS